jgi:hypothetical protein
VVGQRYRDVPRARLRVPTTPAFVAWKTVAWCDRHAPRDLWDLWALAQGGHVDALAHGLFRKYGQFPKGVPSSAFDELPDENEWRESIGHQTRLTVTAAQAADVVREAWVAARRRVRPRA